MTTRRSRLLIAPLYHRMPAGALLAVHAIIRDVDEILHADLALQYRVMRDPPDAHLDRKGDLLLETLRLQVMHQLIRRLLTGHVAGPGQHDQKLVSAQTAGHPFLSRGLCRACGDQLDQPVPLGMAKGVVDVLQAIDIHEQDG